MMQGPVIECHGIFVRTKGGEVVFNKVIELCKSAFARGRPSGGGSEVKFFTDFDVDFIGLMF